MKRFAALTLFSAVIAMAQPVSMRAGTSYGPIAVPGFLPPALDPMDPAGYWASALGLDSAQQASLKTILADQETADTALMSNLEQARAALAAGAKANNVDSDLDRLAAELGSVFAQATAVQAKAYARFYALLTPDQRQKLDKISAMPEGATLSVFGAGHGTAASAVKQ
jgi:Spy/CpxP family protein refolding chaperone